MIKPWECIESQPARSFHVFSKRTDTAISPRTGMKHDFYVIESRDWVNIIPAMVITAFAWYFLRHPGNPV